MGEAPAPLDLAGSLSELERLCVEHGRIAESLVGLAEYPVETLRAELARVDERLCRQHPSTVARALREAAPAGGRALSLGPVLAADHPWFELSVRELGGYLDCVARDPHGGNRQALGQYWRLLVEAIARHAAEERERLEAPDRMSRSAHRRY